MKAFAYIDASEIAAGAIFARVTCSFLGEGGEPSNYNIAIWMEPNYSLGTEAIKAQFRTAIKDYATTNYSVSIPDSKIIITTPEIGVLPAAKQVFKYSGSTNSSGEYTVVYGSAFSSVPNVQASIRNQSSDLQSIMITNSTVNGFTVKVVQRNTDTLLGIVILRSTVSNVNNASVDVLVSEV